MGAGEEPARGPQDGEPGRIAPVPQFVLCSAPSRVEAPGTLEPAGAAAELGYTDDFGNLVEEEEESDDEYGYEDSDEFSDDE